MQSMVVATIARRKKKIDVDRDCYNYRICKRIVNHPIALLVEATIIMPTQAQTAAN